MKKLGDILVKPFAQGHTANYDRAQTLAPGATLINSWLGCLSSHKISLFPIVISVEEISRMNVIEKQRGGTSCLGTIMTQDFQFRDGEQFDFTSAFIYSVFLL